MSTQVATNTTHRHAAAPLRVPRRPPRNDVTQAIQKFLPYAVVFLLSLMIYSSFKSSTPVSYPPYSPPNMLPEETTRSSVDVGSAINERNRRLAQVKRRAEENVDAKIGHWATWRAEQASKLESQKAAAEAQWKQDPTITIPKAVSGAFEKVVSKGEEVINDAMDAADWWKAYGEKIAEEAKQFGSEKLSESQDFAYDAMYAWKQTAGHMKDSAADKLGDLKDVSSEKLEGMQEKISEVKDTLAEKVVDLKETAAEKIGDLKETAAEWTSSRLESFNDLRDEINTRANTLRDETSQAAFDLKHRMESVSVTDKVSSIIDSVKESVMADQKARPHTLQQQWAQIDTDRRASAWMEQLEYLGEDVRQEILRKLNLMDRADCVCDSENPRE